MAFNGNGIFQRLYSWVNDAQAGIKIRADRMDNEMNGMATGLSTCITKDGQTTITANLPMAGFRHTGVSDAQNKSDYYTLNQAMNGAGPYPQSVGGTTDIITLTFSPSYTSYVAGMKISFLASGANTTNVTINVDGLGAKALTKFGTTALVAGDIPVSGAIVYAEYDGTRFQLISVFNGIVPDSSITTAKIADGAVTSSKIANQTILAHGECRMVLSGSNLSLNPYGGNKILINSVQCIIPSTPPTLAPTGLVASTLYYIYVYMNGTTMTLEASTTGHVTDSATGIEVKSGDVTRTFVGWAATTAGTAWVDSDATRYVISFYNRRNKRILSVSSGTTTGGAFSEINSPNFRVGWISTGDDAVMVSGAGTMVNSGVTVTNAQLRSDTSEISSTSSMGGSSGVPIGLSHTFNVSEGIRYVTLFGSVTGGTGTYNGEISGIIRG